MARYKVGQKAFKNNHLLNINAVIESKEDKPNVLFDVIYMEFSEGIKTNNVYTGYDIANKIDMKFNSYELRVFANALKEILAKGSTEYRKYSNPALANSQDNVKELSLGQQNNKYFFNIEEANKKKFAFVLSGLEVRAMVEAITLIADETDTILFKYQREIDKRINQEKMKQQNDY